MKLSGQVSSGIAIMLIICQIAELCSGAGASFDLNAYLLL